MTPALFDAAEAQVMRYGTPVGYVPQIEGSEDFDEAQIVDAVARTDYDQPIARGKFGAKHLPGDCAAEEGLDERGAGGEFGRGSLHPHLAAREDVGPVGDREHGASALLDDQHRGPARG